MCIRDSNNIAVEIHTKSSVVQGIYPSIFSLYYSSWTTITSAADGKVHCKQLTKKCWRPLVSKKDAATNRLQSLLSRFYEYWCSCFSVLSLEQVDGAYLLDGQAIQPKEFKRMSGYVMQVCLLPASSFVTAYEFCICCPHVDVHMSTWWSRSSKQGRHIPGLYDLYDLADVAGWEPYSLHDLA